ncbi:Uncharacterised protein [Burkholderia pseudomallei]|nr:Uncharacterised protein [Burkholderia pseudomallei]
MKSDSVKYCLKTLSWPKLRAHLEETPLTQEDVNQLLTLVYHSDQMVRRRVRDNGKRRDELLDALTAFLRSLGYTEAADEIPKMREIFGRLDAGYAAIFESESRVPGNRFTATQRIAATLKVLENTALKIQSDIDRALKSIAALDPDLPVFDVDGNRYNPAAVFHNLAAAAGNIIMMEAYREEMFNERDEVVLPELPSMNYEEAEPVVGNFGTAHYWKLWKAVDERTRFLGGDLKMVTGKPSWFGRLAKVPSDDVDLALEFETNVDAEAYIMLAGERFDERQRQTLVRLFAETNISDRLITDDTKDVPLLPTGFLSLEEGNAAIALHHALSVSLETAQFGYLTVAEILRGYATLNRLSLASVAGAGAYFPRFSRAEIEAKLTRYGLSSSAAAAFISVATFNRKSRDLYDCPLIRCADDSLLLFGWTMTHADLAKIVLSAISGQEGDANGKGKIFETRMIELLRSFGFHAKNVRVNRGPQSEEFDFDIVFTWGDYAFFVECKNRGLPGDNPIAMYYFNYEIRDHIKQVHRLRKGLEDYPDILEEKYPEAIGKRRIFCVVNALPFAMPPVEDVYFSDESLITRFFESGSIGLNAIPLKKVSNFVATRLEVAKLWEGEKPTPEDFIRYLADPPQLKIAAAHYTLGERAEWFSEKVVVKIQSLQREPVDVQRIQEILSGT